MSATLRKRILASATLLTLLLPACASTHKGDITSSYAPPGYSINELIIVGFTEHEPTRQKWEQGFADRMSELGTPSATSYEIVPRIEDLDDDGALQEAKAKTGANTSVLIEVIDQNEAAETAQGVLFGVWVAGLLTGDRSLRRVGAWGGLAASDAAANFQLRVTLWNMSDDSLLWSMDTETYTHELANKSNSAAKLAEVVHEQLRKDGLL